MHFACKSNYGWGNVSVAIQQISTNEVKQDVANIVATGLNLRASLTGEKAMAVG